MDRIYAKFFLVALSIISAPAFAHIDSVVHWHAEMVFATIVSLVVLFAFVKRKLTRSSKSSEL